MAIFRDTTLPQPKPATYGINDLDCKQFLVDRTQTTFTTDAVIPSQGLPILVTISGPVADGTSPTIDLQLVGVGGATVSLGSFPVGTTTAQVAALQNTQSPVLDTIHGPVDMKIQARFSATGATTGGPYLVSFIYKTS